MTSEGGSENKGIFTSIKDSILNYFIKIGCRPFCYFVIAISIISMTIIIATYAGYRSPWHLIPLSCGPLIGLLWSWKYHNAVKSASQESHGALPIFVLSYLVLCFAFAVTYLSWNKYHTSGNQIVFDDICVDKYLNLAYFSLVTGTTLGYGDMNPQGYARFPVCVQMFFFLCFVTLALIHVQNIYSIAAVCPLLKKQKHDEARELDEIHPEKRDKEK